MKKNHQNKSQNKKNKNKYKIKTLYNINKIILIKKIN